MSKLLILEPFHGGSHKQLIDILTEGLSPDMYTLVTLPDKKWHWRARTSALFFSQKIPEIDSEYSVLLASSVLNLAELVGLRPELGGLKKVVYFHENQLVYPVQDVKQRDFQFGYNQITTCLAADLCLFNSKYSLSSFLKEIRPFLRIQPDHRPDANDISERIEERSSVVYFPLTLPIKPIDVQKPTEYLQIVWPHRWEHDKDPLTFLKVLLLLNKPELKFKVFLLGQVYSEVPPDCLQIIEELGDRVAKCGAPETKEEYFRILACSHVVVSTARHETYGVAVMEAVSLGARPLLPNRLVYPELYPKECIYMDEDHLRSELLNFIENPKSVGTFPQPNWEEFTGNKPLASLMEAISTT